MKRTFVAVVVAVAVLGLNLGAQSGSGAAPAAAKSEATAPVLSEMDQLKIENAFLKINAAQQNLDKLKADFQALISSLQKPGYQIQQGQDGKLTYVADPKPEPKK